MAFVSIGAETDSAAPADVIIVLGCNAFGPDGKPSPCMRARASHAAALYRQGLAAWIIPSGGPTEEGPTETSVLIEALQANGVPASAIVPEENSSNTIQNIYHSQAIMQARGWRSAILVTEPFHIKRASLIARNAGLIVYPSPALDTPNWQQPAPRVFNITRDAASLMLYQVKSLLGVKE